LSYRFNIVVHVMPRHGDCVFCCITAPYR